MSADDVEPRIGHGFPPDVEGIDRRIVFCDEEFLSRLQGIEFLLWVESGIARVLQVSDDIAHRQEVDRRSIEKVQQSVYHGSKNMVIQNKLDSAKVSKKTDTTMNPLKKVSASDKCKRRLFRKTDKRLHLVERLAQVVDDVVDMLGAHRKPHCRGRDMLLCQFLIGHL